MSDTTVITRATDATTVTMADAITVVSRTEATTVVGSGNAGPAGSTGATGPAGATGAQGPQGDPGATGATGATGPQGDPGATGATGAAGSNGVDGKTVLNGAGAPGAGLGVNGDFYIDTTADAIYGPKTAGAWGSPTSLIGPTGAIGAQGDPGEGVPVGGTLGQVLTKDSGTDYDTSWQDPSGGALTYPTLAWNQYTTAITVAALSSAVALPLDTANDATLANPAGWTIAAGALSLPAGLYAIHWYWETAAAATGTFWDNYIEVSDTAVGTTYPTAPMAQPDSYWGSCSTTVKLGGASGAVTFWVFNIDVSNAHDILNKITVTRLDA